MKNLKLLILFMAVMVMGACGDDGGEKKKEDEKASHTGTVVVNQGKETEYTKEDVGIIIVNHDNWTVDIKMLKVQFAERMPELDITIPGVTVMGTGTPGEFTLSGDGIVPLAMGGEYPDYTITGLTGSMTSETITFEMMCGPYPVTYTGTAVE